MTDRQGLSDEELWESSNPRFGRVRAVMVDNDFAGALDDLKGDYREVSLELYRRGPDGWLPIASIDDAGFPGAGEAGGEGGVSGVAYAFGRGKPNTTLTDWFFGETRRIQTNDAGWWLAARDEWDRGASSTSRSSESNPTLTHPKGPADVTGIAAIRALTKVCLSAACGSGSQRTQLPS